MPRFLGKKLLNILHVNILFSLRACAGSSIYLSKNMTTDTDMRFYKNFLLQKSWQKNRRKNVQFANFLGVKTAYLPRLPRLVCCRTTQKSSFSSFFRGL